MLRQICCCIGFFLQRETSPKGHKPAGRQFYTDVLDDGKQVIIEALKKHAKDAMTKAKDFRAIAAAKDHERRIGTLFAAGRGTPLRKDARKIAALRSCPVFRRRSQFRTRDSLAGTSALPAHRAAVPKNGPRSNIPGPRCADYTAPRGAH